MTYKLSDNLKIGPKKFSQMTYNGFICAAYIPTYIPRALTTL